MSSKFDYKKLEKELFNYLNSFRINPKSYIEKLSNSLQYYTEFLCHKPNETPIQTHEGKQAVSIAISYLEQQEPLPELAFSNEISMSCRDLIRYLGPNGLLSYDEKNLKIYKRLEKYCEWDGAIAENIDFGFFKAENIIMNFLIDDGDKNRYQRYNILYPDFKYVGIGAGEHKEYGICVVVEFALNVRRKGSQPINVDDFISKHIKISIDKKNQFQEEDPDAPDNTVSLRVEKESKKSGQKDEKITTKIYSLSDGTQHMVVLEEPKENV